MKNKKTVKTVLAAFWVSVITFSSWLSIPTPLGVSFTLQTFSVALAGMVLGILPCLGCILTYLILGLAGIPVFSAFSGGIGVLLGPTGGFLLGFIPLILLSALSQKPQKTPIKVLIALSGVILCHISGVVWLSTIGGVSLAASIIYGSLPFILKDIICTVSAVFISEIKIVKKLII